MVIYLDLYKIGTGGYGEVWFCERTSDKARFARKRLLATADADSVERFKREVRLLSNLDHPNVVKIVAKELTTHPYSYVMPFYRTTLEQELPKVIGDDERVQKIFMAVLDAVEYAHGEGVIHRDLKAANILMNDDSDLVVSDFGLGRQLDSDSTRQTISGFGFGTVRYMAPEQFDRAKHADARSDVFALGRLLYELHTAPLKDTSQDLNKVSAGIALIVSRATHPDPARRFQDVTSLKSAYLNLVDASSLDMERRELAELLTRFSAPEALGDGQLRRFLELFTKYIERDEDLLHKAMMAMSPGAVAQLFKLEPDRVRDLLERFCESTAARGWGFSYTDKIATVCRRLSNEIQDPRVRAMLFKCVASVGAEHNRFFVLETAGKMVKGPKNGAERVALIDVLGDLPAHVRRRVANYVKASKLDVALQDLISEDATDPEPPLSEDDLPF